MATVRSIRRLRDQRMKSYKTQKSAHVSAVEKEANVAKKYLEEQERVVKSAKLRFTRAQMTPGSRSYIPKRGGISARGKRIAPSARTRHFEQEKSKVLKSLAKDKKGIVEWKRKATSYMSFEGYVGRVKAAEAEARREFYSDRKSARKYARKRAQKYSSNLLKVQRSGYGVGASTGLIYSNKKVVGLLNPKTGKVSWRK